MPLKVRTIEASLKKKGFTENVCGKHKSYIMYINGIKTPINTRISHGYKEIDKFLIRKMAMQMKISKKDFERFVECSLSEKEYKKLILTNKK